MSDEPEAVLYAVKRVWLDVQPHKPKSKIVGQLALLRQPDNIIALEWKPNDGQGDREEAYRLRHTLREIYSVRRKVLLSFSPSVHTP